MRRREFIKLVAASTATWPLVAQAQQNRTRRVGVIMGLAENAPETNARVRALRLGMRDLDWVEGRNVQIEYRFTEANMDLINKYVAEMIKSAPDVIVANSSPVVAALKSATSTIPVVFVIVNDPVGQGFISNLKRPGGNITGYSFLEPEIIGKWINLLSDVKPDLSRVKLMFNPDTAPYYDRFLQSFKASPGHSSVEISAARVRSAADVDLAFAQLGREQGGGLIACSDPYIVSARGAIVNAARQYSLPVLSPYKQFVAEGSLMSYAPDAADICRRSSSYVDRILKGEAVGSLPAQSPDRFELAINLKTAKALGLSVPQPVLLLADEVIE